MRRHISNRIKILPIVLMLVIAIKPSFAIEILPKIETLTFVYLSVPNQYKKATKSAEVAFLTQANIKNNYNSIRKNMNKKVSRVEHKIIKELDDKVMTMSPIKISYLLAAAGVGYSVLVQKNVTKIFTNPYAKNIQHYVKWSPELLETGVTIRF